MSLLKLSLSLVLFLGIFASKASGVELDQSSISDDDLLDQIERRAFLFFWEQTDPRTGQIKDRAYAWGRNDTKDVSSIAATGFGLTGLCIAHQRGYRDRDEIEARVQLTLEFLWYNVSDVNGFYYHFFNMSTGERVWNSELSSIDTSLLIAGVLTTRQYFKNNQVIQTISTQMYDRIDWAWMTNGTEFLNMGWNPENGFLNDWWNRYCELMILVLQAIGSDTHPIPASGWDAFSRPLFTYENLTYIHFPAPLFVHQFSHAWIDFKDKEDNHANYFENSVTATKAAKMFCIKDLGGNYSSYNENFWGLTASDTPYGYDAWGGPPLMGRPDGSIVPCAAAGSIPFLPEETIAVLRNLRDNYPRSWQRYGFIDAFNPIPESEWYNTDVVGIDVGVTMLMAENYRTGFVWRYYMQDPHIIKAMNLVGFRSTK